VLSTFDLGAMLVRTGENVIPGAAVSFQGLGLLTIQTSDYFSGRKGNIYNILWVVVFGFATLNILGLITRRLDPRRTGFNFGEILAIAVVVISLFLLAWEMLYLLHILPIKLQPR
jgi:hypothetical protein